ncbi:hypothetical protein ACFFX0_24705 [Citricoccus parietis]|uniref:Uncharacterized protein n=1 Tax=Citricoccus parietis TaxID=592307 RepID=A0ABV5G5L4_9MICC
MQEPHCPWSQPFLGEVLPARSRRASSRVVRVSTVSSWSVPSIRRVMPCSGTCCEACGDSVCGGSWSGWCSATCSKGPPCPAACGAAAHTLPRGGTPGHTRGPLRTARSEPGPQLPDRAEYSAIASRMAFRARERSPEAS